MIKSFFCIAMVSVFCMLNFNFTKVYAQVNKDINNTPHVCMENGNVDEDYDEGTGVPEG